MLRAWSGAGINELFVADAAFVFPTPVSLSGTLQNLGNVTELEWAPDDQRIAYRADQLLDQRFDLFTVFADGSQSPIRVSELTFDNNTVGNFGWAPDSSRVAYIADQDTVGIFELYTDNATGTSPRKVSDDLVGGEDVGRLSGHRTARLSPIRPTRMRSIKTNFIR